MTDIINVITFKLNNDYTLVSFTATWCGPCCRIKPFIFSIFNPTEEEHEITKEYYKKNINDLIPFFIVVKNYKNLDDMEIIEKIQTSNQTEFLNFALKYLSINDNNF